ncbi:MAG: M15 family metallopeptidase [Pseudomonadales bacterium]|nr:M15 family metallopeptidase [Pseudomonadales bacterium]MCP5331259.1 M15 family metallopeptidase [Pseudomonadales bacterium]MCP5344888.1 M15 family metallopeptidase [Pseudomonadales bacterium]
MKKLLVFVLGLALNCAAWAQGSENPGAMDAQTRPDTFVSLQSVIPKLVLELRYFSHNNFIGRPIDGYRANIVYMTRPAALALKAVQDELASQGLGLKVFDAYRPQTAVNHFMRWAADSSDTLMKQQYYPSLNKDELFPGGYIAERSGHSRGSTVDLTLVRLADSQELDMGSPYDFFDEVSWPSDTSITEQQRSNRMTLREAMLKHGFRPLDTEWWHFTLEGEPYTDVYFDFPVE